LSSLVHKIDAAVKFLLVVLFILAMVSEPRGRIFPFYFYAAIIFIIMAFSKVPLAFILKRLFVVFPFIIVAAVFLPLSVSMSGQSVQWNFNDPWVLAGLSVFFKASLSVLILLVLVSTTGFHELLAGLRRLKVPVIICTMSAIMYRYIFILADESMKTSMARQSRTPGKLKGRKLKVLGNQMSMVFLRSWNRSKIVYASMLSRGFHGEYYLMESKKLRVADVVIFCIFVVVFCGIRFMRDIEHLLNTINL